MRQLQHVGRRLRRFGLLGLGLLALGGAGRPVVAAELRVVGSDLLGADFSRAVQDFAQRNDTPLTLALEGSRAGLARLQSGAADIGLIVLPPGETPPDTLFKSVPLAYHIVVVLAPEGSPLTQVTFRELGGIFGASEATSYTRWGELRLTGEWASRGIAPQAMAAGSGLALELFRRLVLGEGQLRSVVQTQDTLEGLLRKLEADAGAIGLAGVVPPEGAKVRVLPVARNDQDVAFGPTPENVHAGDYPLRMPVWLVVRREAGKAQLNFLRFLLSDEVAPLLQQAGLVALPLQARNQLVFDFEQL